MESERHHLDKAEAYMQQALAMGRSHTDVAGDLVRLADVYLEQDAPARAAPALVRAWAICRDAPVSLEQKRATAQRLARVYRKLAREPDALVLDAWLAANDGRHN